MKKFLVCILSVVVACSMLLCFNGCKSSDGGKKPPTTVNFLFLNTSNVQLEKTKTFDLEIVMTDATDTSSLTFTSANTAIATVSADGVITAVSEGSVTITITLGTKSAYCEVRVFDSYPAPVIACASTEVILDDAETFALNASVIFRGSEVIAELNYSSSNEAVAQVSEDGVITGLSIGYAEVTISGTYDNVPLSQIIYVAVIPSDLLV